MRQAFGEVYRQFGWDMHQGPRHRSNRRTAGRLRSGTADAISGKGKQSEVRDSVVRN